MTSTAIKAVPFLPEAQSETDKTDKTDIIGNEEFLLAVFRDLPDGAKPILASVQGNPNTAPKSCWNGMPWIHQELHSTQNNYFSLASFRSDGGIYRRKKAQFLALHAIVLDDVGTKVPDTLVSLPPSWRLETSPGNYQYGYLLKKPVVDAKVADDLMKAIIAGGLCDAGANGPTARLCRLPVGINGKRHPFHVCRLADWVPDLRYSLDELTQGFGLVDLEDKTTAKQRLVTEQILIPRPDTNPVIEALTSRGFYKSSLGEGKHDITCPWVHEHTDQIDRGTAYFEPKDQYPYGGFKCQHGHCGGRHLQDLLSFLEVAPSSALMKPTIRVLKGEVHRIIEAAESELAKTGEYYQRGGAIAVVSMDPASKDASTKNVNSTHLVAILSSKMRWEQYDGRSKDWIAIDPPPQITRGLAEALAYHSLPVLKGIVRQPFLREDGSVGRIEGYDAESGMYGAFDPSTYDLPDNPNKEEAGTALEFLSGLLEEFPFANETDRSAALSAMLTAAVRTSLPTAPMFHARSHQPGSGKTYLNAVISAFATPRRNTPMTFPQDDEECRKLLLAELLRSPAVIEFDNLTGDLVPHKSLCAALTSEAMTGRVLGVSQTVSVGTRALFLSSGNNVGPVRDMARRCITINLDPAVEQPALRKFKRRNLLDELRQDRPRFVSAALTIIRAWIVAGRPRQDCPSLASFDAWSDLCRQPLLWLGSADPVCSLYAALEDDPEREMLGHFLKIWRGLFGERPMMVRELIGNSHLGSDADELYETLMDIAGGDNSTGNINRRRLGRWIKRNSGRQVGGLKFVRATGTRSVETWRVVSVS